MGSARGAGGNIPAKIIKKREVLPAADLSWWMRGSPDPPRCVALSMDLPPYRLPFSLSLLRPLPPSHPGLFSPSFLNSSFHLSLASSPADRRGKALCYVLETYCTAFPYCVQDLSTKVSDLSDHGVRKKLNFSQIQYGIIAFSRSSIGENIYLTTYFLGSPPHLPCLHRRFPFTWPPSKDRAEDEELILPR